MCIRDRTGSTRRYHPGYECKWATNTVVPVSYTHLDVYKRQEYISRHPDLELVEIYDEDDGYSGTNMERPGFQRMLQDMRSGKIDCAISKDLSRFSRNYIEAGNYLEKIFPSLGIRYIAVNDCYDSLAPGSASDAITLPFKNLVNDIYCRDISCLLYTSRCV